MTAETQFGRYRLVRQLATGGMAEIWLAKQAGPGGFEKHLVIKRILPHLASDADFVAMFLDEARLAAQLSHPNIAQVTDFGEEGGTYYLAMELVRGPDLRRLLRSCNAANIPVPVPVAARIASQTCAALAHAHRACDADGNPLHIIHRDISPQNILVSLDGNTKLVDFGIAKAASRSHRTESGMVKGKFNYMAPEQLESETSDPRTDLFAVGLVFYELLTGRMANPGEGQSAISRTLQARFRPAHLLREGLPTGLLEVLDRALQKEIEARYPDAEAMESALETYLSGAGVPVTSKDIAEFLKSVELQTGDTLSLPVTGSFPKKGAEKAPLPAPAAVAERSADGQEHVGTLLTPKPAPVVEEQLGEDINEATTRLGHRPEKALGAGEGSGTHRSPPRLEEVEGEGTQRSAPPDFAGADPESTQRSQLPQLHAAHAAGGKRRGVALLAGTLAVVAVGAAVGLAIGLSPPEAPPEEHHLARPNPHEGAQMPQVEPTHPAAAPERPPGPPPTDPAPEPAAPAPQAVATSEPPPGVAAPPKVPPASAAAPAGHSAAPPKPRAPASAVGQPAAPAAAAARLSVEADPAAEVEIDGKKVGRTPTDARELSPGPHAIRLTNAELGLSRELTVQLEAGQERTERVAFAKGKVTFIAVPWAEVSVNGKVLGQTPMPPKELWEGVYRLKATNPDTGKEIARELVVDPGKDQTVKLDLR